MPRKENIVEARVFNGMMQRCYNPNNPSYHNYGGRGIKVHERWHDFNVFLAEFGKRPSPELTIDRIDNDGDYEPGNVRWATRAQQARNNRRTKLLTISGETHCLLDWAALKGINWMTVNGRLKAGRSPEEALSTPVTQPHLPARKFSCFGRCMTIREWADVLGVKGRTIEARIHRGWTPERAIQEAIHANAGKFRRYPNQTAYVLNELNNDIGR